MTKAEWIKTKTILQSFKNEYKHNYGLGMVTHVVMLVVFSVLLALVEDKIKE